MRSMVRVNPGRATSSNQHEELFLSEALYSATIGIPQGYHSVANFIRAMVWHAPERVESVLACLPEPTPLMLDDDQSRGSYAEIMLLAAGVDDKPVYLNRALEAFETLKASAPYQKRKWGETLYKLGRYAEADYSRDDQRQERPDLVGS
ncbi:hypothetical protein BLL42_27795 (plasmid) [Pseudomonas frederiksbergensis]|uniref:Type III secretion protein n=2 Tax=Pseudomonas frederiksbergensis TaxID=104087 RepID=A0A1J0EUF1_9PSED|nr:hypothetical protein BLL42_27795 [Pseudomonas frederiksbergensis]